MDFFQKFLAIKKFFETKTQGFTLDITSDTNSSKTEKEQIEIIRSQINEFKNDGNGSYIKFTFSNFKSEEDADENPITFVFLVELPRIVIIPIANRIHRRKDTIKNWDDLVGIETLIKKYEEEYKEKEE